MEVRATFHAKISKEIGKAWRKSARASPLGRVGRVSPQSRSLFSALFQTFCLTALAYLTQTDCFTVYRGLFLREKILEKRAKQVSFFANTTIA